MTTGEDAVGRSFLHEALAAVPVIWVGVIVFMSARGLVQSLQAVFDPILPSAVANLIYLAMASSVVRILGGAYVLGLAWRKSTRFAFWFTVWAIFVILSSLAFQVATLFIDAFVATLSPWLMTGLVAAISTAGIVIAHRAGMPPRSAPARAIADAAQVPVGVVIINAVLGFILGGGLGLLLGFGAGSVIVDWLEVSCFEGGCGYAAVAIALLFMIVGAVAGLVFAIWRTRRRRAAPAA